MHTERHRRFDLVIIGAGPASLFLARELLLLAPKTRIGIIDDGKSLAKRTCPLIDQGHCTQCKTCQVVAGVGGAGMFSDGKLSLWPAGSGLKEIVGDEEDVVALNAYVLDAFDQEVEETTLRTVASDARASALFASAASNSLDLKCYDVVHLGTEGIQACCARLEAELLALGVEFLTSTICIDVDKFGPLFVVDVKTSRGRTDKVYCDRVVFATGKASGLAVRRMLSGLGVEWDYNAIELGVRIETHREAIAALSSCHLDAKIKLALPNNVEVRSFCVCDGGYLVSCYYDAFVEGEERICTVSGFAFHGKRSNNGNFGILVRKQLPRPIDPIRVQLGIVQAVNRASGRGGTVVQRLEDFRRGVQTTQEALDLNSVRSTLSPVTPTDLRWLLPDYIVNGISAYLARVAEIAPGIAAPDTLLHAPVWEMCTDRIKISKNMETSVPGLYVVGDACGWARGIVQAASTGVIAGRHLAANVTQI